MSARPVAIIIGSGIAGLASAVRLAVQGFQVKVFEKNNVPGGKLGWLEKDGFCFDTGPSLFVQPENLHELFEYAGEDLSDYLSYKKIQSSCKYFFADGTNIKLYSGRSNLLLSVINNTDESAGNINKYLEGVNKTYTNTADIFLNKPVQKFSTFLNRNIFKALASVRFSDVLSSLHSVNKRAFDNKNIIQLFDRFATYNGSNPFQAPGMFRVITQPELNEGVYYPEGGMISIVNALYALAKKKGVEFNFNSAVQKINTVHRQATSVTVNNENVAADVIISNADVYNTYRHLVKHARITKRLRRQERSSSAVVFYWGMNKVFNELQLHNIFFSENYKEEFEFIFRYRKLYHDPTIYINITSKLDAHHAPGGKENWFVMVNTNANTTYDTNSFIQTCKQAVVNKLSKMLDTDITSFIETEEVLHPKTIEANTAAYCGALYGASSNTIKSAFMRPANFSKQIKRLYFAGGTVHPGGGIPLCLKSANIVASLIEKDKLKWKNQL